MCAQCSPSLITTSLARDHIPQIIARPLFRGSVLPNWHQTLMLLPWGRELLAAHIKAKNYTRCLWFHVFNSEPTLLSLIAARSVPRHFYERLRPINPLLIFHRKVASLLMASELWSVSVIEIALHSGGKKHYSFMFLKDECVIDSRMSKMATVQARFEALAFSYSAILLCVLYLALLLDFTKPVILNDSWVPAQILNRTKPFFVVNKGRQVPQKWNVA